MSAVIYRGNPDQDRARRKALALSLVGLCVFLAFQAVMMRNYVRAQKRPPSWDEAVHMEIALDYREAAKAGNWSKIMHLAPKPGMPPFPPLYHLLLMRAYDSPDPAGAALWVNYFYLAVFSLALFMVCFAFRPDWAALGATVAFACSPAVLDLLYTQLVDIAVLACVAAGYWALIASDDFLNWTGSLAFGAIFALGMLHKWSYFSYMLPGVISAGMALSHPKSRLKVAASAALALAGFLPWYWSHLAILAPRLVQASTDMGANWSFGTAILAYFFSSISNLGPLFWGLGWMALATPNYKENKEKAWVIWAWVGVSYLFWTFVPNRQMRFVLPGLSGLAAAMCGAWPTNWIWGLAGVQLLGAVNFAMGWISPVTIPLPAVGEVSLFLGNAPSSEDWHIADILKTAESAADPAKPLADLTLVANAQYFNGANFTWMDRYLKLPKVHIRGVNRRLCEFSEFLVLKDDKLGPAGATEGLEEASDLVREPAGWFAKSYEKLQAWPLPDGSNAVLYRQKKFEAPPFKNPATEIIFYESEAFTANELKINLGQWDAQAGVYPKATVSAGDIEIRGVKILHPVVELENVVLVPAGKPLKDKDKDKKEKVVPEWDDVRFLKASRLRLLSAEVSVDDLKAVLQERMKGVRLDTLTLDKTVKATGEVRHFPFSAEASVELNAAPRGLKVKVLHARLGASELPAALLGGFAEFTLPLDPSPEFPFAIEPAGLTMTDGRLTIP